MKTSVCLDKDEVRMTIESHQCTWQQISICLGPILKKQQIQERWPLHLSASKLVPYLPQKSCISKRRNSQTLFI